jgi:hypothetical protein
MLPTSVSSWYHVVTFEGGPSCKAATTMREDV